MTRRAWTPEELQDFETSTKLQKRSQSKTKKKPTKKTTKKTNKRVRGWCFTVHSWDEEDCANVLSLYKEDTNCTYLCVGWERCSRTKKKHLQCYAYYTNPLRWSEMKNRLLNVHIEPQKSKLNVKAYAYCQEDGDYCEFGHRPRQGNRTDLEIIRNDMLHKKKPMSEISKEYFAQYCQYSRQFNAFREMHGLRDKYETTTYVYDESTIEKIFDIPHDNSLIMRKDCFQWEDFLFNYHSGKYKRLFIPLYDFYLGFPPEKYNFNYLMEL
ncbi:replication-associated protein [Blackfly DNA Virus 1]|nr:replication-associated protein [Blackfly DNA Virus 1]